MDVPGSLNFLEHNKHTSSKTKQQQQIPQQQTSQFVEANSYASEEEVNSSEDNNFITLTDLSHIHPSRSTDALLYYNNLSNSPNNNNHNDFSNSDSINSPTSTQNSSSIYSDDSNTSFEGNGIYSA